MDNASVKICLMGISSSMVTMTFPISVNQNGPDTSSTTNHRFYRALGRIHGPWCKQTLTQLAIWLCRAIYYCQIVYVHGYTIAGKTMSETKLMWFL